MVPLVRVADAEKSKLTIAKKNRQAKIMVINITTITLLTMF